jgi:hypothetical protein
VVEKIKSAGVIVAYKYLRIAIDSKTASKIEVV